MKEKRYKKLHLPQIRLIEVDDVLIFIRNEVPRTVSDRFRKWLEHRRMMT